MAKKGRIKKIQPGIKNPLASKKAVDAKNAEVLEQKKQQLVYQTMEYQKAIEDHARAVRNIELQFDGKVFNSRQAIVERMILGGKFDLTTPDGLAKLIAGANFLVDYIMDNETTRPEGFNLEDYAYIGPKPEKAESLVELEEEFEKMKEGIDAIKDTVTTLAASKAVDMLTDESTDENGNVLSVKDIKKLEGISYGETNTGPQDERTDKALEQ